MSVNGLVLYRRVLRDIHLDGIAGWRQVHESGGELLFHRITPAGDSVRLADEVREFASASRALDKLSRRKVASTPWMIVGARDSSVEPRCTTATISNVHIERLRASVDVDTSHCAIATLVVFTRPWYPGYVARLNDVVTPLLRADALMPAVEVKPGARATVEVLYRPKSLVIGSAITALAALMLAAAWLMLRDRRLPR